jgi:hypothetical protein
VYISSRSGTFVLAGGLMKQLALPHYYWLESQITEALYNRGKFASAISKAKSSETELEIQAFKELKRVEKDVAYLKKKKKSYVHTCNYTALAFTFLFHGFYRQGRNLQA